MPPKSRRIKDYPRITRVRSFVVALKKKGYLIETINIGENIGGQVKSGCALHSTVLRSHKKLCAGRKPVSKYIRL